MTVTIRSEISAILRTEFISWSWSYRMKMVE